MIAKRKQKRSQEDEDAKALADALANLKKINKNYIVTFLIIIAIAAVIVPAVLYSKNSASFVYEGVSFTKNYTGSILFYTAHVPYINSIGEIAGYVTVDFMNNPRKLEYIKFYFENLAFIKNKPVYVSYQPSEKTYEHGNLAGANLGRFLRTIGLNPKAAMNDKNYLNNTNLPYVNCENTPNNTVIMIAEANESFIQQTSLNCYKIFFSEKEILEATERFELTIIEEFMKNFG
jgi:hypothetical protein